MDRMLRKKSLILSFLLPALVVFTGTVILPIIWSIYYSLFHWNGVSAMRFIGFENFAKLINDRYFVGAFVNNIIYVLINLVGQVFVGLLVALLLTKLPKGNNFFKTVYFAPAIMSAVALGQFFQKFYGYDPVGILNAILIAFGKPEMAMAWLGTSSTALVSVALIECYKNMGLYMVIIYSGLVAVPKDVIESAQIDGAQGVKMFWYIKMPYIRGVLGVALVMAVNGLLKAFDIPFITTYGGPGSASELVATYMYKTAFTSMKYGYGSAIAVFLAVESVVFVSILRAIMSRREEL